MCNDFSISALVQERTCDPVQQLETLNDDDVAHTFCYNMFGLLYESEDGGMEFMKCRKTYQLHCDCLFQHCTTHVNFCVFNSYIFMSTFVCVQHQYATYVCQVLSALKNYICMSSLVCVQKQHATYACQLFPAFNRNICISIVVCILQQLVEHVYHKLKFS